MSINNYTLCNYLCAIDGRHECPIRLRAMVDPLSGNQSPASAPQRLDWIAQWFPPFNAAKVAKQKTPIRFCRAFHKLWEIKFVISARLKNLSSNFSSGMKKWGVYKWQFFCFSIYYTYIYACSLKISSGDEIGFDGLHGVSGCMSRRSQSPRKSTGRLK